MIMNSLYLIKNLGSRQEIGIFTFLEYVILFFSLWVGQGQMGHSILLLELRNVLICKLTAVPINKLCIDIEATFYQLSTERRKLMNSSMIHCAPLWPTRCPRHTICCRHCSIDIDVAEQLLIRNIYLRSFYLHVKNMHCTLYSY